ncbi:unnamed protein product [Auanema sp. JU1783]|nr:unnamed protein product [Auanema sp. JU1783]
MKLFLLGLLCFSPLVSADLKFLIAIWRHGDRAPESKPYPNDLYSESNWPRGWNQLTNIGMQQTYELGQWFRERYVETQNFLPSNFNYKKIYYQSSDSERAIQSAHAHAAGMFPAKGDMVWTSSTALLAWQPIPIHTNGYNNADPLLKPTSYDCPSYSKLVNSANGPYLQTVGNQYEGLFAKLSNYTNMTVTIDNVKDLYDITREIAHSLKQPDWVYEEWNGTTILNNIIELKRITRTSLFNTEQKSRYRAGYLLNDWCQKLEDAGATNYTGKLATLYSSHDGTLSALSYLMGVNDNQLVPYAAAIIAELHSNNTVRLLYRTSSVNVTVLRVDGCGEFCPLNTFLSAMNSRRIRTISELEQTCSAYRFTALIMIVMSTIFML